jgi:hypothetical protein
MLAKISRLCNRVVQSTQRQKWPKAQGPGCLGKSGPIFNASRKAETAKGLSKNDLCALCFLLRDLLFFTSGGYKSGKIFIPKMRK